MPEPRGPNIGASRAFLITVAVLSGAFVWKTFFPGAPFELFAATLGGVFGGYITKRLLQKQEKYQAENRTGGGGGD